MRPVWRPPGTHAPRQQACGQAAWRTPGLQGHKQADRVSVGLRPAATALSRTVRARAGTRLGGLAAFEAGTVDLDNDLNGLTEKGIDNLRAELAALDGECADELRKAVHANYTHFISASQARARACPPPLARVPHPCRLCTALDAPQGRTQLGPAAPRRPDGGRPAQGINKLEGDMGALRNLLANAATLLVRLKEAAAPPPAPLAATAADEAAATSGAAADWDQTPEGLRCARGAAPARRAQDKAAALPHSRLSAIGPEVPAREAWLPAVPSLTRTSALRRAVCAWALSYEQLRPAACAAGRSGTG